MHNGLFRVLSPSKRDGGAIERMAGQNVQPDRTMHRNIDISKRSMRHPALPMASTIYLRLNYRLVLEVFPNHRLNSCYRQATTIFGQTISAD